MTNKSGIEIDKPSKKGGIFVIHLGGFPIATTKTLKAAYEIKKEAEENLEQTKIDLWGNPYSPGWPG